MSLGISFLESLVAGGEDEKILNNGEMKRRQGNLMCISLCWLLFLRPYIIINCSRKRIRITAEPYLQQKHRQLISMSIVLVPRPMTNCEISYSLGYWAFSPKHLENSYWYQLLSFRNFNEDITNQNDGSPANPAALCIRFDSSNKCRRPDG